MAEEGRWEWIASRAAGLVFTTTPQPNGPSSCDPYTYIPHTTLRTDIGSDQCAWNSGEPNDTGGDEDCGFIQTPSTWNDYSCAVRLQCAACERSPCNFTTDCVPNATNKMTGDFYPNCRCECKEGYKGVKCEIAIVDQGPYVSEYTLLCEAAPRQWHTADEACAAIGSEWRPATVPTAGAMSRLVPYTNARPLAALWAAASAAGLDAPGEWQWTAGRLSGVRLSVGAACVPTLYAAFNATYPSLDACPWATTAGEPSIAGGCMKIIGGAFSAAPCADAHSCTLCERSPCRMDTDCYGPNTAYINSTNGGYYPSCQCVCKEGSSGDRCEWPLVVTHGNGLYPSTAL